MGCTRRDFLAGLAGAGAIGALAACGATQPQGQAQTSQTATVDTTEFRDLALDEGAWHYDAEHNAWWQIGLTYCTKPATKTYERLGIYVPGAYLKPADEKLDLSKVSESDKIRVALDAEGTAGAFTASTAPIVMPVNCADFAAQAAPAAYLYDGLDPYLSAGLVYVFAGCRGRSNGYDSTGGSSKDGFFSGGAPWGVADLKAAVRYLRYNRAVLPGDTGRIFVFGHAAGGGLAAIMGSSGNSALYDPYLTKIGAATHDATGASVTDDVAGAMCWCPQVSLGSCDAAYEWGIGQFSEEGSRAEGSWTRLLSNDLAVSFASHVNALGLRDESGAALTLDQTEGGIYTGGTYYERMVSLVQGSLEEFLRQASFPYTEQAGDEASGDFPGAGVVVATVPSTTEEASTPVTYATLEDYVDALNADGHWVTYNSRRGTVRIAGIPSFARRYRKATKDVPAFDAVSRNTPANQLFGNDESDSLHFSQDVADQISAHADTYSQASGWDGDSAQSWADDLAQTDSLGQPMDVRRNMYDPLYYLSGSQAGFGTAKVAAHWRINSGMFRTDTPVTADANLALALKGYDGVQDVSYTPVWGAGRVKAEQSGDATAAFVAWVTSRFQS